MTERGLGQLRLGQEEGEGDPAPKQGGQQGLAVVGGEGGTALRLGGRDLGTKGSQRPPSYCCGSSHPSCQREGSAHLGQVWLVANAKRLSADLHLSFAYISIRPTDWLLESPLPYPCLQARDLLGGKKPRWVLPDGGRRLTHKPGLGGIGCSLRMGPSGFPTGTNNSPQVSPDTRKVLTGHSIYERAKW